MSETEVKVPNIGDFKDVEVIEVLVSEGQILKKNKITKPETEQAQTKEIKTTSHDISSASPKARKFARELGVDISHVVGSEKDGRVIEDDIKKFVSSKPKNINEIKEVKTNKIKNEFEHSDFGEIEIKDIPRVKKLSSTYLTNSWTTIPHVTNHDEADITAVSYTHLRAHET